MVLLASRRSSRYRRKSAVQHDGPLADELRQGWRETVRGRHVAGERGPFAKNYFIIIYLARRRARARNGGKRKIANVVRKGKDCVDCGH